jgi:endogenous inhibitor of DNA gyrase (YacG/DUF329 family)
MNSFYLKLKENLGLSLILMIGLSVEFSNFQAMFFRFMSQYRADWGAFNHLPAVCLSAFLLLCIVIFGIRKQTALSWFLALLTCVISFSVYSRMDLSWEWENMSEVHFVILILSGMLPMLVAYTTHQIAKTDAEFYDSEQEKLEGFIREIRRIQHQKQQSESHNYANTYANSHANTAYTNTKAAPNFGDEPSETYKQKINYDRNTMIRPEKMKTPVAEIHECEECGNEMEGKRKGTKYCSKNCSLSAQKRKRSLQYEESLQKETVKDLTKVNKTTPKTQQTYYNYQTQQYNSQEFDNQNFTKQELQRFETLDKSGNFENLENFEGFENGDIYTFEAKNILPNAKRNQENTFSCETCGKETKKRSNHSRYCSEVCRISALRNKNKSDFFIRTDDFDTTGVIEWSK